MYKIPSQQDYVLHGKVDADCVSQKYLASSNMMVPQSIKLSSGLTANELREKLLRDKIRASRKASASDK